jgi:hypothetical protein
MSVLRTFVYTGGPEEVDIAETPFGFREWTVDGKDFKLNGVVWRVWAELTEGKNREDWLANYRRTGQRSMRLMGAAQGGIRWAGLTPSATWPSRTIPS